MRVAALYDIHGNLPALEAVLRELALESVDLVVVGGDVLPGPMPAAVLDTLLEVDVPVRFIAGNGDRDTVAIHQGSVPERVPEAFVGGLRWVAAGLTPDHIERIAHWPLTFEIDGSDGRMLFCHATPRDDNELFTRLTAEEHLLPIFGGLEASLIICGHTHMPFDRSIGGVRVINAGSVGMPFGEPGACWAIVEGNAEVEFRHTEYDLESATARIGATGYPLASHYDLRRPPGEDEMLKLFEASALRRA